MGRTIRSALPLVLLALAGARPAAGQEGRTEDVEPLDRTPQECLTVSRIDRTEVFDDRTIVFHLRGREAYRNYLPRRCPGLDRSRRFMYQVTSNRLCDIDTITVLEQFGTRLERGFTCPLGQFHPISQEEIEELRLIRDQEAAGDVQVEPAELPEDAEDAAAPPTDDGQEAGSAEADEEQAEEPSRRRRRDRRGD
ncbi:MAG TPA: DUF6491 family protein [Gammaproteobacteria bacterium]